MKSGRGFPKVHISLDEETHKRLRVVCAYRGTTIQAFVENLIRKSVSDAASVLRAVAERPRKGRGK